MMKLGNDRIGPDRDNLANDLIVDVAGDVEGGA